MVRSLVAPYQRQVGDDTSELRTKFVHSERNSCNCVGGGRVGRQPMHRCAVDFHASGNPRSERVRRLSEFRLSVCAAPSRARVIATMSLCRSADVTVGLLHSNAARASIGYRDLASRHSRGAEPHVCDKSLAMHGVRCNWLHCCTID